MKYDENYWICWFQPTTSFQPNEMKSPEMIEKIHGIVKKIEVWKCVYRYQLLSLSFHQTEKQDEFMLHPQYKGTVLKGIFRFCDNLIFVINDMFSHSVYHSSYWTKQKQSYNEVRKAIN